MDFTKHFATRLLRFLTPQHELLSGDLLRVGYEDAPGHRIDAAEIVLAPVVAQRLDRFHLAGPGGDNVVQDDHAVAFGEQGVGKVRADETGAAGDEDAHGDS